MTSGSKRLKIFAGNANPELAKEICQYLGVAMGKSQVTRFSDGEIRVKVEESVRGSDAFIIQPTSTPVNEHLMELLIMADALRRASARRITAVIPYYGYARQDRKTRARDPITAKLVANILTASGCRRIITMDLHAGQIQGFFDIPVDHLPAVPILAEYFQQNLQEDVVVVSPDIGGVTRARDLAERIGSPLAIIDKRRPEPNVAEVTNIIGNIKGKTVIMIDDIIDTAGTITKGAAALMERGAKEIYVCCTHAVLSGPAIQRLEESVIKEVVITNTIPLPPEKMIDKIKVLSVAPLLGEAIIRIHEDLSVSKLFS
ncbi:ribose-phosphate pyrophosphokinase [Desulfotomaculum varum]|uniref:Ribose-phosphate pyrophosphokinase n=1 Tax=Desulforamulus hydrothermalis Lam5 = DSM 18033 TaxID=1121428 RepID=K8EAF8_9FIRM|nr:ribose-phosphate pyrophosphokinase [Desulforamulus hydrothermalis]CCO08608.1 Ribose-phosphate pyrophosphokinase [Desulforamulus hydrothermalis Lam5 = DSM 18033]SHH01271.1 ribose-phosphate pyrophosphokinase [Desulforamulus hydrothermalis Lam5 = DSM 18033]